MPKVKFGRLLTTIGSSLSTNKCLLLCCTKFNYCCSVGVVHHSHWYYRLYNYIPTRISLFTYLTSNDFKHLYFQYPAAPLLQRY